MKLLDLGLHRRVRVWRDGDQLPVFESVGLLERKLETRRRDSAPRATVSIEAVLPRGAMVMYGALGGMFQPNPSRSGLTVKVHHLQSGDSGAPYASDLVVAPDKSSLGLPLDVVEAVMSGVNEQLILRPEPGPGELVLDRALHGVVGSSAEMFRMLARAVVWVFAAQFRDDEELTSSMLDIFT